MKCSKYGSAGQAQKHQQRAVEPQQFVIGQLADSVPEAAALHGGDLVGHKVAGGKQAVVCRGYSLLIIPSAIASALVLNVIDLAEQSVATASLTQAVWFCDCRSVHFESVLPHCGLCLHPIGCADLNENQHIRTSIRPPDSELVWPCWDWQRVSHWAGAHPQIPSASPHAASRIRPGALRCRASLSRRCGRPVGVGFFAVLPMASPASSLSRSALRARDALVLEHLPLADAIASVLARRLFPLVEREDLIQVAREALVSSAPRCRAGEPAGVILGRCIANPTTLSQHPIRAALVQDLQRHRHRPLRHPRHRGRDPQGQPQPQSIWESQPVCGGEAPAQGKSPHPYRREAHGLPAQATCSSPRRCPSSVP
jgi:hypothetical protein